MKNIRFDKNSIVYKLTIFVIVLIVGQSALLITTMIVAGVLTEAEETAFQTFYEKVDYRKDYIQREMRNRWTNVDPYLKQISSILPTNADETVTDEFLDESAAILISMLRTTMTNGTFLILNDELESPNQRTSLYFRDYDPSLNDKNNKDIYFISGPFEISQSLSIPMDQTWSYTLELTDSNRKFYDIPTEKATLSTNSNLLGYWSGPFTLTENDLPIITYSMPLFDKNDNFRGVIGVELLVNYFNQFLPANDLQARDSLGYLIGYKGANDERIRPLITSGALQERMIETDKVFQFSIEDDSLDIFLLENHQSNEQIYASVQKMNLYSTNTPFEQEEWYLIGLMRENILLSFVKKIEKILILSFFGSIIIGGLGGYFISYYVTKPILLLAKQVKENDIVNTKFLTRTGLSEIDNLSRAMETANKNLLETTTKLSRIIKLVEVPIAAFEFKEKDDNVFVTDQLTQVLSLTEEEVLFLSQNKTKFIERLSFIMERQEEDEFNVFKISDVPEKWVRINMAVDETSTLGVIMDVTEEIKDKNKIKLDRDHDMLTKIYNRGAFERDVTRILSRSDVAIGAFIMLDLDFLKKTNDSYGHKWGDLYITSTASYLTEFARKGGIIGRLSGDEFAVFLFGFETKTAIRELVNSFYKKLEENPIQLPVGTMNISISGGLYWLEQKEETYLFDEISQKADQALYEAKNNKKGSLREYQ